VAYGNGQFVVGGEAGMIMTSPDATTWTVKNSGTTWGINAVSYGNGQFVAVGGSGTILTSLDGTNWMVKNSGTTEPLTSVTYGNGQFVAVGNGGTNDIVTSPDGMIWTAKNSGAIEGLSSVTYGNRRFVAVGGSSNDQTTILTSLDGMTWTAINQNMTYALVSVTYGDSQFVAVGNPGVILSSNADIIGVVYKPELHMTNSSRIKINCANNLISVSLSGRAGRGKLSVKLFTASGKTIYSAASVATNGILNIPAMTFPEGMYVIAITDGNNNTLSAKFSLIR
jgi:hypothetical protein